ncbi:hypothetical protein GT923_04965 [Streptococcus pyogenes]|nr:Hypothetical protein HKU360_00939 [Streptococcus pyogenes]EIK41932.1 hypothetical protein SPYOHK_04970 [Streptococcus pyogenes HKU QMH11M0907901]EZK62333.1 hypothetical protein Z485_00632 [Streptococcus pyogenes ABC020048184]EZK77115.1 hypothetical protein Z458_00632 [Streptococcus pyogenes ABC020032183]EZK77477.1 hypothetical protein Z456_00636 [Streptococcus pyogenes ABC020031898]EZK81332.1 hypothetical protein Z449_00880 [Streptococcus pyogenes ABC020026946]EZK89966.1 hypothetical prote
MKKRNFKLTEMLQLVLLVVPAVKLAKKIFNDSKTSSKRK